jgi:hypothetical protein
MITSSVGTSPVPSQVGHLSPSAQAPSPIQVGHLIILNTAMLKGYPLRHEMTVRFCSGAMRANRIRRRLRTQKVIPLCIYEINANFAVFSLGEATESEKSMM